MSRPRSFPHFRKVEEIDTCPAIPKMTRSSMKSLSIVLPFFNESGSVEDVLMEVKKVLPDAEVIAVDDGSTDGTGAKIAALNGVRLVSS